MKYILMFALLKVPIHLYAQLIPSVHISNNVIDRNLTLENGRFFTKSFRLQGSHFNFVSSNKNDPGEFSFTVNGQHPVSGKTGWKIEKTETIDDSKGNGSCIYLQGIEPDNNGLLLKISYLIYPDLPVIRKKMVVVNNGDNEISLDNIDIESLTVPWRNANNIVFRNYGRFKHIGPYLGDWDDPAVILHDQSQNRGMVLGNEAPGITKRISSFLQDRKVTIGLTHENQDYPCRVWLKPGEQWESPWTFVALYNNKSPVEFIDGPISEYIRKYMGIRLAEIPHRPTFVYNTWNPFRRSVNDKLIRELADAAAACGVQEFVIDDGWQTNFGDWEIDRKKFPDGLKPVFNYIKSKGMKPGLWLSMGAASTASKVYQQNPDWFVQDKEGHTIDLHSHSNDRRTACFTTGWKDYIKGKILGLVREHGLEYVKLDFAIATSAYIYNRSISGCYAKNHPHKDRGESFLQIYRAAWKLFDELHAEAPNLFIDCTFETMGALQMIDYDMCKHAEGNWLSNFEEPGPAGSLRVRQMAWWRSHVIPATAMVIGNQSMDGENSLYSFKSLIGTLPIMLGDPRKIGPAKQKEFKKWASWLQSMEEKHHVMLYRQDLAGFSEPSKGQWDGFQRINTDSGSGGIFAVFKQNAIEQTRRVSIRGLLPDQLYNVKEAVTRKVLASMTGEDLQHQGFRVTLNEKVDCALFEIDMKE